jgi:hypothetical protein
MASGKAHLLWLSRGFAVLARLVSHYRASGLYLTLFNTFYQRRRG